MNPLCWRLCSSLLDMVSDFITCSLSGDLQLSGNVLLPGIETNVESYECLAEEPQSCITVLEGEGKEEEERERRKGERKGKGGREVRGGKL